MITHEPPALVNYPIDLASQGRIRLPLPIVTGNRDYKAREALLLRMNDILIESGIEREFIAHAIGQYESASKEHRQPLTDRRRQSVHTHAKRSLRSAIARILSNESHRQFSCHMAESPLLQWFCGYDTLVEIRVPAKSTVQRMEADVPVNLLTQLNTLLLARSTEIDADGQSVIGLAEKVDLSLIWMDTTCAPLDIHYPVDWALLRDGTRSIMRAIEVIRRHGLKHRMPDPTTFVAAMNKHAMAMSGASRRGRGGDKARARKYVLRAMKRVAKKVQQHGRRYLDRITKDWKQTDLSQKEAQLIIDRLSRLLQAMPAAIKQAHERIIGERVVPNDKKILSLYEPHANVYVRGKAGADAEFGLQMLLCESAEGLIVDCQLTPVGVASDSALLIPAIKRLRDLYGPTVAGTVVADRGFASAQNSTDMKKLDVNDSTLPRSPEAMDDLLNDPVHRRLHKRRAQTEARIGLFKANFLGDHLPTKGLTNQQRYVAWATLAHNLWVLGRLDMAAENSSKAA